MKVKISEISKTEQSTILILCPVDYLDVGVALSFPPEFDCLTGMARIAQAFETLEAEAHQPTQTRMP